jgi:hypothetical protein
MSFALVRERTPNKKYHLRADGFAVGARSYEYCFLIIKKLIHFFFLWIFRFIFESGEKKTVKKKTEKKQKKKTEKRN